MIRRLLPVLGLLLLSPAYAGEAARYACTLRPGPPVRVRVYQEVGGHRRPVGPEFRYRHRGKMASAADVDGDGRVDLLVLVYKTTRHDPRPAWRPFVYTLWEGRWRAKWRGSRVGRPLREAVFVHVPGGARLLTVERFAPGRTGLTLYHWTGFGFQGEWTGPAGPAMSGLQARDRNGDGVDEITIAWGGRRHAYVYADGGYTLAPGSTWGGSR
jgi:hypothetical protein